MGNEELVLLERFTSCPWKLQSEEQHEHKRSYQQQWQVHSKVITVVAFIACVVMYRQQTKNKWKDQWEAPQSQAKEKNHRDKTL